MIAEQRPDIVIVTTPDYLHDHYIVRALRLGCDVITEKPMTIDLARLKAILDAQRETGRSVTVTFNYRYTPAHTQLKDMLMSGAIGEITAVDFRWYLDRVHGADYFRRWHRYKDKSGGLLVHKATHHFDLVNWWVASYPETVTATRQAALLHPADGRRTRPGGSWRALPRLPGVRRCDYRLDLEADDELRALYLEAEGADGYYRDRCVFCRRHHHRGHDAGPGRLRQRRLHQLHAIAYSPWEGYEIIFHGTKGELHAQAHRGAWHRSAASATGGRERTTTTLHRRAAPPQSSTSGRATATMAAAIR